VPEPDPKRALGERPTQDALVLKVAQSRVANALFATQERVRIGRYQLLERAGAGGMGVVWSAWDPELERRVAIKLMHIKSATARAYMLREGQSLAKLSHPNIVPIYDVGTVEDQVYLVMEWIAGVTLRAYCAEPRSTTAIVAICLAAGAGVAAAHRAGIVQRDFKPDNVMIGDDGRVRVLDFGLARSGDRAQDGSISGTPKYMAPEQAQGSPTTPAADQYSFGVSLREAFAPRELPAWIAAVVARATAHEPGARYPDMAALLAALARDPARLWRRRALAAGAVVAAGAAFAVGAQRGNAGDAACSGAGAELAQVWSPARSGALIGHVRTLGPYGESQAAPLAALLASYGASWTTTRRAACLAHDRNEIPASLYERGLACLERSRAALDAVATSLTRAPLDQLPDAVRAARSLPAAERCIAEATTDAVEPPAAELAARVSEVGATATRARYFAFAADPAATEIARSAAQSAAALGYAPLLARAQLALGAALERDRSPTCVDAYGVAVDAALQGGDDVMFVEAFARQLFVASRYRDARAPQLAAALPLVTKIAQRTGPRGGFARALVYNNAGSERLAAGDEPAAIAWFRKAHGEPEPAEGSGELSVIAGNLAMLVGDRGEREQLFAQERAHVERALGPAHPFTMSVLLRAALFVEDPREATTRLGHVCDQLARLHPQQRGDLGQCYYELAWLAAERGDTAEARRRYTMFAEVARATNERVALARAELSRLAGDPRAAVTLAEPIARANERGPAWWQRLPAADAWLSVGAARQTLGDRPAAIAAWRAARHLLLDAAQHAPNHTGIRRRLARANALRAIASRDRAHAEQALAWYRSVAGYDAMIRELTW
jgi:eukaryotic-like serine/threonine-protein kinase